MSKTYFATGNIKHNEVAFVRGDEVTGLSDEQAKSLLEVGAISTEQPEANTPDAGEDHIQTDAEKAEAREKKGQESQESKDENRQPEVGGESSDSGESSIDDEVKNDDGSSEDSDDESNGTSQYKVLKGLEYPKGTVHEIDSVLDLTEDEAGSFAEGLIEKIESTDESGDEGPGEDL